MKRLIMVTFVILLVSALSSVSVFAQRIKVGLKGGVNLANFSEIDNELDEYAEYRIVVCGGGFISLGISESLAIQPEVLFTGKGALYEETFLGESIRLKMKLDYLEIPLLLKLSVPPQSQSKLIIFGGPAIAIKLSAKSTLEVLGEIEETILEDVKNNDYGIVVGAGFDFGGFVIEGRYTIGLTPIDGDEETDIKNRVISFMAGVYF